MHRRETSYFHDFAQYPKYKFFAFPQPPACLYNVLKFGTFFSFAFLLKDSYIKECNWLHCFRLVWCVCVWRAEIKKTLQTTALKTLSCNGSSPPPDYFRKADGRMKNNCFYFYSHKFQGDRHTALSCPRVSFCYRMKNNSSQVISTARSSEAVSLQLTLCVVILLTAVISNGIICFLVVRFKTLRTVPNILTTNLAYVEVLNILVNVSLYMVYDIGNEESLITSTVAWVMAFLVILFVLLNLTSMFIVVADRYFAIAYTMKYYVWKSPRKALVVAITAWITALVAAVLGSAVPLYNVELGTKSLFCYRTAYATKTNLIYYMSPIFATLVTSIAITTILTLRETRKTKSKSEDSRNVALRRNNGKIEQAAARSTSTILLSSSTL